MTKLSEIHCILQYLVDKIPFIADDAKIEKYDKFNMHMNVDAISLYSCDEMQPKIANVYLCRPEHLCELNSVYQDTVLFCVNNGKHVDHVPDGYSIIVINCSQSLECIFNSLQKTIVNLKMSNILLDRAILEEMSIQDILAMVEQIISNPFLLLDADFKLLGWSKFRECTDSLYTETIDSGVLPDKYIIRLISQDILSKLYIRGTIVLSMEQRLSDNTVVMVMLKNKDLVIGYGMLICSRREARQPMIHGFEEIFSKLRTKLSEKMDVSYSLDRSEIYFYIMLMNGTITDSNEIQKYAEELHINRTGEYMLHVIHCNGSIPGRYAFKAFVNDVVDDEIAFVYGNSILVIEYFKGHGNRLADKSVYHKFLESCQAKAGISTAFYRTMDIRNAYIQADLTFKIGEKLSRAEESTYLDYSSGIYRFAEYVQYLLLEKEYLRKKRFPITCIRLIKMISLDAEKETDYARTLLVYLQHNCHITETAQDLFLHRNSIYNRIRQISDMLNMNLEDYNTRSELLFDFKVIDYAKAIGKMDQLMELID